MALESDDWRSWCRNIRISVHGVRWTECVELSALLSSKDVLRQSMCYFLILVTSTVVFTNFLFTFFRIPFVCFLFLGAWQISGSDLWIKLANRRETKRVKNAGVLNFTFFANDLSPPTLIGRFSFTPYRHIHLSPFCIIYFSTPSLRFL